jgi:hemoglobin
MATAHKDMGLQNHDFNALVENLQAAMDQEGVPFHDQNRLLAKLAPMQRTTVERPPKL